jgi:predicted O-methyltransferase YrrM/HEAT repeat protein
MKTKVHLLCVGLFFFSCCKSAQVPSAQTSMKSLPVLDSVLEAYLEASGGREALLRVENRLCSGRLTWLFPDGNPSELVIPAQVFASGPDRWRLLLDTSHGPMAMGFDGRDGWVQNSDRIYMDDKQQMSSLAFLFSAQGPLHPADYFPDLALVSKETVAGRALFRVEPRASGNQNNCLYFDARSGLLVKIGDDLELGDYREVQGITLPFRIAVKRGKNTATYTFDRVEYNAPLSLDKTSRPTSDQVFPEAFEGLADSPVLPLLIEFPSGHEDMNVPCRDGRFLYDLICGRGYRRGLEIGTFTGYSALWFGWAFQHTGGSLITIEIEKEPGEEAQQNVRRAGLEDIIDARIADAFAEIPKIPGEFDFVFIDAWKPDYMRFLEMLRGRVKPGGVIVAHNVTNYARDMQDFLKTIRDDPGLETTLHEISAEGMSISFVRDPESNGEERIKVLIQMLGSEEWEKAVGELAGVGEDAVPHLIKAMRDYSGHRYLPYRAALTLGRIGSGPSFQGLLEAFEDPSVQDYVKRGIIQGLGEIRTDSAAQALIRFAQDVTLGSPLRRTAVRALANFPTDEVLDVLNRILQEEGSALGYPVTQAFAEIGTEAALDALLAAFQRDPGYLFGAEVLDILQKKRPDALLPLLFETLRQESWWNWHRASEALVKTGKPAEQNLIDMLEEEHAELRRRAACILGQIPSERAVEPLISSLDEKDWMVRNEALVALARIHRGRPMQPLIDRILKEQPDAEWASGFLSQAASRLEHPGFASEIPPPAVTPYDLDTAVSLPVYPELLVARPSFSSPVRDKDHKEYITAVTKDQELILVPVTIENGEPYVYARHGKGTQLAIDAADFPALASSGLHSEQILDHTQTITGRSIAEITALGRPERSSGVGFMARDEDIISVLLGDNRLVRSLGLRHPDLARPMFHLWNLILENIKANRSQQRPWGEVEHFFYNGKTVYFEVTSTKGWQESIFEDEIYGGLHIHVRRDLDDSEKAFLGKKYGHLKPGQIRDMDHALTHIHLSEMEPYYIMRYGFYEGHTDYRADPLAIAFIFGLRSLEDIEAAFPGKLYEELTTHFTR